jgi:hypothetical protein
MRSHVNGAWAPVLLRAMYVRVEVLADAERIEAHEVEGLHNHLRHERTNTQTNKHSNEDTGKAVRLADTRLVPCAVVQ